MLAGLGPSTATDVSSSQIHGGTPCDRLFLHNAPYDPLQTNRFRARFVQPQQLERHQPYTAREGRSRPAEVLSRLPRCGADSMLGEAPAAIDAPAAKSTPARHAETLPRLRSPFTLLAGKERITLPGSDFDPTTAPLHSQRAGPDSVLPPALHGVLEPLSRIHLARQLASLRRPTSPMRTASSRRPIPPLRFFPQTQRTARSAGYLARYSGAKFMLREAPAAERGAGRDARRGSAVLALTSRARAPLRLGTPVHADSLCTAHSRSTFSAPGSTAESNSAVSTPPDSATGRPYHIPTFRVRFRSLCTALAAPNWTATPFNPPSIPLAVSLHVGAAGAGRRTQRRVADALGRADGRMDGLAKVDGQMRSTSTQR
ncbi:hypothetical protein B0H17DRAFT_1222273 [Mycena rosella]|uniref:Uncharacterized protein n=1 Tax=Mycena rosella TaxID=1033263 RepID=A0AAD7AYA9_MYCRO|nr:hypothetical protein B0H17DRAFT_1222273 [Mycena rosella]